MVARKNPSSSLGHSYNGLQGGISPPLLLPKANMENIGYWNLLGAGMKKNLNKTNTPGLSQAVLKQRLKKESSKVECLVKAIEHHKESTPDEDIRICDQNLWSAGEMIDYGK